MHPPPQCFGNGGSPQLPPGKRAAVHPALFFCVLPSENGWVIEVTEPQVWVLIGVFATAIFGMIGIVTTSFNRTLTTTVGGLRETMEARFETMDARFEAMDAKFTGKFEILDRDIQSLSRHVFGADPR